MLHLRLRAGAAAVALLFSGVLAGQTPQPSAQFPDIPLNVKPYFIAFYVKAAAPDVHQTPEQHEALLRQHLAYMRSQTEAGKYLIAGPLMDEGRVGGIAVIRAASAEEARQIAEGDPMIQSGQMTIEIHPGFLPDIGCVKVEYQSRAGK